MAEGNVTTSQQLDLISLLSTKERDFLVRNNGDQIPVSQLEGKTVGLYFSADSYQPCLDFTRKLLQVYETLKGKGEDFEIVVIQLDDEDGDEDEYFKVEIANVPCLVLPREYETCEKLIAYFEPKSIPGLIIIGPEGRTLHLDAVEVIKEYGADAYPFTPEKLAELAEIRKAKVESVLVSKEKDYVIDKSGSKLPVSQLVGKHILLYFSAHWCAPCRAFTPLLLGVYHEIKAKEDAFEVIFISSDRDQDSFDEYYSGMPWLALPFSDERTSSLPRKFRIQGIPTLVALGPSGRTVCADARGLVEDHGADAFPFTDDHILRLENEKTKAKEGYICEGGACRKA